MTVTLAQISADCGEVYDAIDGGTTAVTAILTRAQNFVDAIPEGASTDDAVVRPLIDAMVANQVIGGIDPVNKTIGNLSVGNKDLVAMRNYFKEEANKAAVIKGYSLDGLTIIFNDSES